MQGEIRVMDSLKELSTDEDMTSSGSKAGTSGVRGEAQKAEVTLLGLSWELELQAAQKFTLLFT